MADVLAICSGAGGTYDTDVLDITTTSSLASFNFYPETPSGIAVLPDASQAYVLNGAGIPGHVFPINLPAYTLGTTIVVDDEPGDIAASPDGTHVYTANYRYGTVTPIATPSNVAGANIPTGSTSASYLAVNPTSDTLYVITASGIVPIAIPSNVVGSPFGGATLINPGRIAVMPSGLTAYVGSFNSGYGVWPVDLIAQTVGGVISTTATFPGNIFLTPDGLQLFVCDTGTNQVLVISTTSNTQTHTISLTPITAGVPNDGFFAGGKFYFTVASGGIIGAIDTATYALTTAYPALIIPNHIAGIPTPLPPVSLKIGNLFIPRKGRAGMGGGYEPDDFIIDWLALENWADHDWSPAVTDLFIPCKPTGRPPTTEELDVNWLEIEEWADGLGTVGGTAIRPLFIPRKGSLEATDLDVNWLAIQNWAEQPQSVTR